MIWWRPNRLCIVMSKSIGRSWRDLLNNRDREENICSQVKRVKSEWTYLSTIFANNLKIKNGSDWSRISPWTKRFFVRSATSWWRHPEPQGLCHAQILIAVWLWASNGHLTDNNLRATQRWGITDTALEVDRALGSLVVSLAAHPTTKKAPQCGPCLRRPYWNRPNRSWSNRFQTGGTNDVCKRGLLERSRIKILSSRSFDRQGLYRSVQQVPKTGVAGSYIWRAKFVLPSTPL